MVLLLRFINSLMLTQYQSVLSVLTLNNKTKLKLLTLNSNTTTSLATLLKVTALALMSLLIHRLAHSQFQSNWNYFYIMNYQKIYDSLISRAVGRGTSSTVQCYFEEHHIIPKCLGGSNHKDNLVLLTASEHFLAHQLLVKIYPKNKKLIFAAHMMTISSDRHKRITNKEFGWLKERKAEAMRSLFKNKFVSEETKNKMSIAKKGKVFGIKNGFYGKSHSKEFKRSRSEQQKIAQLGCNNSNAKFWNIKFPDGSLNTIKCLKEFCKELDVSVYRMKNNKVIGYALIGETN